MKRGIEYFDPTFHLAKSYCQRFPELSGIKDGANGLDYCVGFAKIKNIPAIRKILEASYDDEALEYIDKFFDGFNMQIGES